MSVHIFSSASPPTVQFNIDSRINQGISTKEVVRMSGEDMREKVIKGLECCMSGQPEGLGCDRVPCPYHDIEDCEGHYIVTPLPC